MEQKNQNNLSIKRTFFGAIYMGIFISIVAFGFNAVSPNGLDLKTGESRIKNEIPISDSPCDPYPIYLDQAYEYFNNKTAIFIDARLEEEYNQGHIANSINLPVDKVIYKFNDLKAQLPMDGTYIIYCGSASCDAAIQVAKYLCKQGYQDGKVLIYEDGYEPWVESEYPVEK